MTSASGDGRLKTAAAPLVGTAGWSIPRAAADGFVAAGTHLERYAAVFPVVEINSSFHRPHRRKTYERWAASTPASFRFSVKLPKEISHVRKLVGGEEPLDSFLEQAGGLGEKLGTLLLQLPPSLAFDHDIAAGFLDMLRRRIGPDIGIACEPRHATWFDADAEACLIEHRVARVAADPVLAPDGERPGGWTGLRYHRLHGSPRAIIRLMGDCILRAWRLRSRPTARRKRRSGASSITPPRVRQSMMRCACDL